MAAPSCLVIRIDYLAILEDADAGCATQAYKIARERDHQPDGRSRRHFVSYCGGGAVSEQQDGGGRACELSAAVYRRVGADGGFGHRAVLHDKRAVARGGGEGIRGRASRAAARGGGAGRQ